MTDKRLELRKAIDDLVERGNMIMLIELTEKHPTGFKEAAASPKKAAKAKASETPPPSTDSIEALIKQLKDVPRSYQEWYSEALPVIRQTLPDRYDEFRSLYKVERRKELNVENYGIADYFAGLSITHLGQPTFDILTVFATKFRRQVAILGSALVRLDSILSDITGVLEADLFDTELDAAANLLKAKHVRSAGIVGGVILERHLKRLIANHEITFRKTATLTNLNDALKVNAVYDVPQWRRIQLLADIRNLCGHSGDREPTVDEVEDMLRGVTHVVRSVF
ncbi:hypothetical protein M8C11_18655 [Micromonospora sp. CPM1]|uniref:hypothetical protein n=1 Tax=Micromonospora sp. CPM1 TaxID=2944809 RepID=UPI00207D1D5C|nr:hypothetical protein [Micromonospora sp. CPM1]MCO1616737.1 hypothetical protein [Micromonospora sp. CPM1]